jgi:hypothetical protein
MRRDIIGIDVTIQYTGGDTAEGHLSPQGVHIHRSQDNATLRQTLEDMREPIAGAFKPLRGTA